MTTCRGRLGAPGEAQNADTPAVTGYLHRKAVGVPGVGREDDDVGAGRPEDRAEGLGVSRLFG